MATASAVSKEPSGRRFNPTKLRSLRQLTGLTARAFGGKIGVTGQAVTQYEGGSARPSVMILERIAQVYGVDIRSFFD